MLKFLALMILVASFAAMADQNSPGGTDSCGLGWQVTQKKTFSATTTRGTTNSVVPPTFGMTSGTIGCEQHSVVKADMKQLHYADANYENLMTEIAEGQGEFLTGFAQTMGCTGSSDFSSVLQSKYQTISSGKTPGELVRKVKAIIRDTASLSASCQA